MNDLQRTEAVIRAKRLIETSGVSQRAAAATVGIPESTLRDRLKNPAQQAVLREPDTPGVEKIANDGSVIVTGEVDASSWTPTEVLEAHGLDPDEYEIISVRASRWGNPEEPSEQLRVNAIRVDNLLREADLKDYVAPPAPTGPEYGDRSLVICGDHHAPHHDKTLHAAFLGYLADEQPDQGILLGDLGDFSTISRHRKTPGFAQSVNEVNDAAVGILLDYREASPNTSWTLLRGNHDDRLEYAIMDNNPDLYGVRPGIAESGDEISSLSLRRLWHLDRLGIDLIDTEWNRAKFPITTSLTARHGYMTNEGAGKNMLTKHSNSQIQGHSHRLRFTYRTKHDPIDVRLAVESGTMAEIHEGLGYSDEPDWQQGFITGYAWDDGSFALAPVPYIKGSILLPDGRRFTA